MPDPKILLWDIETTHLCANFGTILCVGYQWLDDFLAEKDANILSLRSFRGWKKDVTDDSRLVKKLYPILESADIWVTYFGEAVGKWGFDEPYVISKLLEYGLPVLPKTAHVDIYRTARNYLRLHRKSLGVVADFLKVPGVKTEVLPRLWKQAMVGKSEALDYVEDHCRRDVALLGGVYMKLRPYVRTHPRVNGGRPCRVCGSMHLNARGRAITRAKGEQYRVQCQDCGAWENRPAREGWGI